MISRGLSAVPIQEQVEDALYRDTDPIGAVVQLVADLVEGLLQREEIYQGLRVLPVPSSG